MGTPMRHEVSGHRFEMRRLEHALLHRDASVDAEPLRAQARSLVAGLLVAAVAVAGCAVFGYLRPRGALGTDPIVMNRATGALYVRIDETLHPALNLASARLIVGKPVNPKPVAENELRKVKRGAMVGIPSAPATIDEPLGPSAWTVCDDRGLTTVVAGAVNETGMTTVTGAAAVLVSTGGDTHLLYGGRRARIDPTDPAVVRALHLEHAQPQSVSAAVLNAIVESAPIAPPAIVDAGRDRIGTVVRADRAGATEHYVVLRDGLQRIGQVAADLIRFTYPSEVDVIDPRLVSRARVADTLAVQNFPDRTPEVVAAAVVCVRWNAARTELLVGETLPLPAGQTPVVLARADGPGPNLDAVSFPPGRSAHLRAAPLAGASSAEGPTYLVTDTGSRFGVGDPQAANDLGLPGAEEAPWAVIGLLPAGPLLSRERARLTVPAAV